MKAAETPQREDVRESRGGPPWPEKQNARVHGTWVAVMGRAGLCSCRTRSAGDVVGTTVKHRCRVQRAVVVYEMLASRAPTHLSHHRVACSSAHPF